MVSSNIPIPVSNMNLEFFIDKKNAIEGLGDDIEMFYMMLGNLEKMSLNKTMKLMVKAYNDRDYKEI